jgi:mono/diheme cytochrome c family protein
MLVGDTAIIELLDDGEVVYDVWCAECHWSGYVSPDEDYGDAE